MIYADIIAKLEGAIWPDREIDRDIALLLKWPVAYSANDDGAMVQMMADVPAFTASIDAALALVERVLPGRNIELVRSNNEWQCALLCAGYPELDASTQGDLNGHYPRTASLAILLALFRALQSKGGENG